MIRELVDATPRKAMTPARRQRIIDAHDGRCAWCSNPLADKPVQIDHRIPLELGGSEEDDNLQPLHADPCHKIKTVADIKAIRKAARIRRREAGDQPKKQPIRSRGFGRDPLSWRNP